MLATLLLEQKGRHVLNGRVQVVHLCERVVHVGVVPGHSATASLHSVQRTVPAAFVETYLM